MCTDSKFVTFYMNIGTVIIFQTDFYWTIDIWESECILFQMFMQKMKSPILHSNMKGKSNTVDLTQMILFLYNQNDFGKDTLSRGTFVFYF